MANVLWLVPLRIRHATAYHILVFRHYRTCPQDRTTCVPWTLSFTNTSFVHAPDPLVGHSYLPHTLHLFVGTRGLTVMQKVPLPLTDSYDGLSSSVCSFMHRRPIHLPLLA